MVDCLLMFQQPKWKVSLESKEEFFLVEWYKSCGLWGEMIAHDNDFYFSIFVMKLP